jgi:hypothetical protein
VHFFSEKEKNTTKFGEYKKNELPLPQILRDKK